ncbi:MAG: hypothetical protein H3C27_01425 [Opitutaceae bacterium]|nr:hypothetical protein [Opitutaceae bacterium]
MTKTALEAFFDNLYLRLGSESQDDARPFVCYGNPTLCSVFIVGFNPANNVPLDGEIWHKETGFNLELFYNKYSEERARRDAFCKQENKKRSTGVEFTKLEPRRSINPAFPCKLGRTRASIEALSAAIERELEGYEKPGVLETNIYWQATANIREFRKKFGDGDKGASLRFLINELNPLVILCHGNDAEQFFRADENRDLTERRALVVIGREGAWPEGEDKPRCNHLSRFPRKKSNGKFLKAVVTEVVKRHKTRRGAFAKI